MKKITRLSLWVNTGRCFGMGLEDKLRGKIVGIRTELRREKNKKLYEKEKRLLIPFLVLEKYVYRICNNFENS